MEGLMGSRRLSQSNDEYPSQKYATRSTSYIDTMREEEEEEEESAGTAYRDLIPSKPPNKSRKSISDRFGSRRFHPSTTYPDEDCSGNVCIRPSRVLSSSSSSSSVNSSRPSPIPHIVIEDQNEQEGFSSEDDDLVNSSSLRGRLSRSSSSAMSRRWTAPIPEEDDVPAPAKVVSLMDLLMEEAGGQDGLVGSGFLGICAGEDDEEEEEEEDDEDDEEGDGEEGVELEHVCCVCMVSHRGAGYAPCRHSFCRLCSRELFVSRGNCPLCNGYILEILDIF